MLVLLYPNGAEGELHLVLTRRTDTVGSHRGQISFPGGSVDPDDLVHRPHRAARGLRGDRRLRERTCACWAT